MSVETIALNFRRCINLRVLRFDETKCIDCGTCETACSEAYFKVDDKEKSAIRINKGEVHPDITVCNQCGECISICPVSAIYRDRNGVIRINKKTCVGCLSCVGFCNYNAMMYTHDQTEPFKCIACGICTSVCPTGAIWIEE